MRWFGAIVRFLLLAVRPLSKSPDMKDWGEMLRILLVVSGFGSIAEWGDRLVPWFTGSPTELKILLTAVFVVMLLLLAGAQLVLKVDKYERPGLELVFDEELYTSCKEQRNVGQSGRVVGTATLFRVGVRATGTKSAKGVSVILKQFDPQNATFLPKPLHPMNPSSDAFGRFDVDPGGTPLNFVSVVEWRPGQQISIMYHQNYIREAERIPNQIPARRYVFTLLAHGTDTVATERKFTVDANDSKGTISFAPYDKTQMQ